jgi:hypothetical protein
MKKLLLILLVVGVGIWLAKQAGLISCEASS